MVCQVLVAVATLLKGSSSWTVMVAEVTPAVSVCAVVVYTSLLAPAAVTVSVWSQPSGWSAELSVAVRTGLAATVSLYLKLALLPPLAMVTLVIGVLPVALSRN